MSATIKARGGQASELTRLKLLPPENLEAIWSWREEVPVLTNAAIRNRIAKQFSVRLTLDKQLSQFWSWYALKQQLSQNETVVETLLEDFKSANPDSTPEQIQQVGQSFFTALALQQQDAKSWFMSQQLALKRDQLSLDKNKFEFDATRAALAKLPQLKAISTNKELSEDQKLEQARLALFGSAPQ